MGQDQSHPSNTKTCPKLLCDQPRPENAPRLATMCLDVPDVFVFATSRPAPYRDTPGDLGPRKPGDEEDYKTHQLYIVPSALTKTPKEAGKTGHQQALDILSQHRKYSGTARYSEIASAGAIQEGQLKTKSCTVNSAEGNANTGNWGDMDPKYRAWFFKVWNRMVETGKIKELNDKIIEKTVYTIIVESQDHAEASKPTGRHQLLCQQVCQCDSWIVSITVIATSAKMSQHFYAHL